MRSGGTVVTTYQTEEVSSFNPNVPLWHIAGYLCPTCGRLIDSGGEHSGDYLGYQATVYTSFSALITQCFICSFGPLLDKECTITHEEIHARCVYEQELMELAIKREMPWIDLEAIKDEVRSEAGNRADPSDADG